MKHILSALLAMALVFGVFSVGVYAENTDAFDAANTGLQAIRNSLELTWSDEFNGTEIDQTKWHYESVFREDAYRQIYTDDGSNAYIEDSNLVIEAKKENRTVYVYQGYQNSTKDRAKYGTTNLSKVPAGKSYEVKSMDYSSARLISNIDMTDKNSFKYGMMEARIKCTDYQGVFPAFWTTGYDPENGLRTWPTTGEIDILESRKNGKFSKNTVAQGVHYSKDGAHAQTIGGEYSVSGSLADDYHVFGIYYSRTQAVFYVDDCITGIMDISGSQYDFFRNYAQNIILNVAVGVNESIDPNFTDDKMLVDWVRVYQDKNDDYSKINILQAENCGLTGGSKKRIPGYNNGNVFAVTGQNAAVTLPALNADTYDIYFASYDHATAGKYSFSVNDIGTDVTVDFTSSEPKMAQHYAGTVRLLNQSEVTIGLAGTKKPTSDYGAAIDAVIIVGGSKNAPSVTLNDSGQLIVFEAEELEYTTNADVSKNTYDSEGYLILDDPTKKTAENGDYLEVTLPNLEEGEYSVKVKTRAWPKRSMFDISVNGEVIKSNVKFENDEEKVEYLSIDCGEFSLADSGDVMLRFTVSTAGRSGAYIDKIELTRTDKPVVYGDLDKDGRVTILDLLIYRYLAKFDIKIDSKAADVNLDGDVNLLDLLLILKYLAKFNVTLGVKQ